MWDGYKGEMRTAGHEDRKSLQSQLTFQVQLVMLVLMTCQCVMNFFKVQRHVLKT